MRHCLKADVKFVVIYDTKFRFTVMQKIKFLMSREVTLLTVFIELSVLIVAKNTSGQQKDVSFLV